MKCGKYRFLWHCCRSVQNLGSLTIIGSLALLLYQPTVMAASGVIACFAMLGGFYLAYKLLNRKVSDGTKLLTKKTVVATTAGGIIFRTAVMAVQNYYVLPLAISMPTSYLLGVVIPSVALFNLTEPLYVIPISYLLAKTINANFKF
jgi:hypothetical protein